MSVRIRDFDAYYSSGDPYVEIRPVDTSQSYYSSLPTEKEVNDAFGISDVPVNVRLTFYNCTNMLAAPRLPDKASLDYSGGLARGIFYGCNKLKIAPKMPSIFTGDKTLRYAFRGCSSLLYGAVIPIVATDLYYMYYGCSSLKSPVSIPKNAANLYRAYYGCTNLTGEAIIRSSPSSYSGMFYNTTKPITLYGDQAVCTTLANTANNGNVSWSPWYDPVPAVTNRGQGSKTTAADMTRMVRNGALAVDTYAPGRMVYQQGDIVREDEWIALVDAAKTIDPTITLSTNYMNLNKIEAAFESAL